MQSEYDKEIEAKNFRANREKFHEITNPLIE
jgi:hypothetical protein